MDVGVAQKAACENGFLLISAGVGLGSAFHIARAHVELVRELAAPLLLVLRPYQTVGGETAGTMSAQGHALANRPHRDESLAPTVGRVVHETASQHLRRLCRSNIGAAHSDAVDSGWFEPEEGAPDVGLSAADQSGDADDLTAPDVHGDVPQQTCVQSLDAEDFLAGGVRAVCW